MDNKSKYGKEFDLNNKQQNPKFPPSLSNIIIVLILFFCLMLFIILS